ncbi:MAG: peptide-methionine (S)-S-oxide reductase [Synergistaceae bacterium]|nr:peptide-methionine (S)-S-oxide reductase [Synergistaceae bacterium]
MLESEVGFLPRIDRMMPRRLDSAFFGAECFFDFESRFGTAKGVWRTVVGYGGGQYEKPTYEDPGDHVEVVMVEYDPQTLSYGQLLDIFLTRCGCRDGSFSQHASRVLRVFVKNEFEKRLVEAAIARYELRLGCGSRVKFAMYKTFYRAEKWCQKRFLRMVPPLMEELMRVYPNEDCLIQSTLATRLNGILGQRTFREFSASYFPEDFEFYDLSDCAVDILKNVMELKGSFI